MNTFFLYNLLKRPLPIALVLFLGMLSSTVSWGQACNTDFSVSIRCNQVTFTPDTINPNYSYSWDFGDGSPIDATISPTHIYFVPVGDTTFDVQLIVSGMCIPDTSKQTISLSIASLPDPSLTTRGTEDEFLNCSSNPLDPDYDLEVVNESTTAATNVSYRIIWGDGKPDFQGNTFPNPLTHLYDTTGLYNIVFIVEGPGGCFARDTFEFFSGNIPSALIGPRVSSLVCAPSTVFFNITNTEGNPNGTQYRVWFDNEDTTPGLTHHIFL